MGILKFKKLTAKRNVTLPKDVCAYSGLSGGEPIDVEACDDGSVVIRKHTPICRFCGDRANAKSVMGVDVCPECASRLAKEVNNNA